MITILPIIFLLLAGGALFVLRRLNRGAGTIWLVGVLANFAVWIVVLLFHWFQPGGLTFLHWRTGTADIADALVFAWTDLAWPYAIALVTFASAVLITAPVRFDQGSTPTSWSMVLFFNAAGLFGLLAATPLAVVFAWMILDLVELFFLVSNSARGILRNEMFTSLAVRLGGTFLLITAMAFSYKDGGSLDFSSLSSIEALLVLAAAVARMGVLPLNAPQLPELDTHRGLTSILRMGAQLTALLPLARIENLALDAAWLPLLTTITIIVTFYGALLWLSAEDELAGRSYWFLAAGGVTLLAVLRGSPQFSIVWGVMMVLGGGAIFLYSYRPAWAIFLPVLSVLGMAGLPFSPTSAGWAAFPDSFGWNLMISAILILLIIGSIRHVMRPVETPSGVENWGKASYIFGISLMIVAQALIAVIGLQEKMQVGRWPYSLLVLFVSGLITFGMVRFNLRQVLYGERNTWLRIVFQRVGAWLNTIFKLNWFFRLLNFVFKGVQQLILVLENILEGQGGVLWALLLLTLLLTIVAQGVGI
jgi:hypothetical protein